MYNHASYHLPAATDAAFTGGQRTNTDSDQQTNSTLAKSSGPATLHGEPSLRSPSSRSVNEPTDTSSASSSTWNPATPLASWVPFTSDQSLIPAGPSTSFRQPLQPTTLSSNFRRSDGSFGMPQGFPLNWGLESVSRSSHPSAYGLTSSWQSPLVQNEPRDPVPEIGNSVASDAFKARQQASSDVSTDELFQVTFASETDLGNLAYIHAQVSILDPLSCRSFQQGCNNIDNHIEVGRFHYGQAFAAKSEAVILKATNQDSGEIVGCAWLQLHPFLTDRRQKIPCCQPGFSLPASLHQRFYSYVHDVRQRQRQFAADEREKDKFGLRHYSIRSLDVPQHRLSTDHYWKVHRKLVSSITEFRPEFDIFVSLSDIYISDMSTFLDLNWKYTGHVTLNPDKCPKGVDQDLRECSIHERTLSGLLRARTTPSQSPVADDSAFERLA